MEEKESENKKKGRRDGERKRKGNKKLVRGTSRTKKRKGGCAGWDEREKRRGSTDRGRDNKDRGGRKGEENWSSQIGGMGR